MQHTVTVAKEIRQIGRQRVTDHLWSCSCGAVGTAVHGFSSRHEAWVDSLDHRQWWK